MPAWLPLVAAAGVAWQAVAPGVWRADRPMARHGALASVRATMLRLDPARLRFDLRTATREHGLRGAWTVDSLPAGAVAACNAGQFETARPWGWLVREGREEQPPGHGPLAMAFIVDDTGRASLFEPGVPGPERERIRLAFQSYPALLVGRGELPWALRTGGRGVNLEHRDARLAIGVRDDGQVLLVLTRFTGLGPAGEQLPWGPTVPEMADWMRALGCRRAMLLDGGLSSQMVVRPAAGGLERWANHRPVPMGMVVWPRPEAIAGGGADRAGR